MINRSKLILVMTLTALMALNFPAKAGHGYSYHQELKSFSKAEAPELRIALKALLLGSKQVPTLSQLILDTKPRESDLDAGTGVVTIQFSGGKRFYIWETAEGFPLEKPADGFRESDLERTSSALLLANMFDFDELRGSLKWNESKARLTRDLLRDTKRGVGVEIAYQRMWSLEILRELQTAYLETGSPAAFDLMTEAEMVRFQIAQAAEWPAYHHLLSNKQDNWQDFFIPLAHQAFNRDRVFNILLSIFAMKLDSGLRIAPDATGPNGDYRLIELAKEVRSLFYLAQTPAFVLASRGIGDNQNLIALARELNPLIQEFASQTPEHTDLPASVRPTRATALDQLAREIGHVIKKSAYFGELPISLQPIEVGAARKCEAIFK